MIVYEVVVYLFEGETQRLAMFLDYNKALEYKDLTEEEWASGPNVEGVEVIKREVITK